MWRTDLRNFLEPVAQRLASWRARGRRLRKLGLGLAIIIFVIGLFVALRSAPADLLHLRPAILIPYVLLLPPISYLIQAQELRLTAEAVGTRFSRKQAIEVVLYSNAATFLPIPGGLLTRTAALRAKGVALSHSASAVVMLTGIAGSVAFAYAGLWLLGNRLLLGVGFLLVAIVGALICFTIGRKIGTSRRVAAKAVGLRILTVIYETVNFVVIFAAIGVSIAPQQAAVLVVSGFIAMALTVFPSGFGVKEAIVALISPLVGIASAVGFLAAATARIVSLAWMIVVAVIVVAWGNEPPEVEKG